jgi:hypothetical protein
MPTRRAGDALSRGRRLGRPARLRHGPRIRRALAARVAVRLAYRRQARRREGRGSEKGRQGGVDRGRPELGLRPRRRSPVLGSGLRLRGSLSAASRLGRRTRKPVEDAIEAGTIMACGGRGGTGWAGVGAGLGPWAAAGATVVKTASHRDGEARGSSERRFGVSDRQRRPVLPLPARVRLRFNGGWARRQPKLRGRVSKGRQQSHVRAVELRARARLTRH